MFLPGRLGASEKEISSFLQGVVKQGDAFLLGVGLEVDKEIPADHEVETGEGRVGQDVLLGEYDKLPYLLVDGERKTVLGGRKERAQVIRRHVRRDGCRVCPLPGLLKGLVVHVGGEDLDLPLSAGEVELVLEQHRDGIGLFPRCAGGGPDPDGGGFVLGDKLPCHLQMQGLQARRSRKRRSPLS